MRRVVEDFERVYRGVSVRCPDGPFEGTVELGVTGPQPVWQTPDGLEIFRCATHPSLQCGIVASIDGRFGSSWTDEFNPLYDSVELFLKDAAVWRSVEGWRYVAMGDMRVDVVVEALGGLAADPVVAGDLVQWWV